VLSHVNGQFEHSPVAFSGTVTRPSNCPIAPCPIEFDLHTDSLVVADVANLLGSAGRTWNLPFLSETSGELPDFRAHGTLAADRLSAANLSFEKFTARLEVGDRTLRASQISAKLGGGSFDGEWSADWKVTPTRYTASGRLVGVALDHLAPPAETPSLELLAVWVAGKADGKYAFHWEGRNGQEMAASAAGKMEFLVANGNSRALQLEAAKPLKFQTLEGSVELEKRVLKVLPSKFRAEKRIYEVSGTVNLADQRTRLKVSNGVASWEVTGAANSPQISPQPITAQSSTVHSR